MADVNGPRTLPTALRYLWRAARLRCPVCGRTPIFPRARTVRRLSDWFAPLDGCPRCGYPYEREPGYFFLAMWAVNCGCAIMLGIVVGVIFEMSAHPSFKALLSAVIGSVLCFHFLFARHAKAFFLALDHFFDPHEREGGDDSGNEPVDPDPAAPAPGDWRPEEPCETSRLVR